MISMLSLEALCVGQLQGPMRVTVHHIQQAPPKNNSDVGWRHIQEEKISENGKWRLNYGGALITANIVHVGYTMNID